MFRRLLWGHWCKKSFYIDRFVSTVYSSSSSSSSSSSCSPPHPPAFLLLLFPSYFHTFLTLIVIVIIIIIIIISSGNACLFINQPCPVARFQCRAPVGDKPTHTHTHTHTDALNRNNSNNSNNSNNRNETTPTARITSAVLAPSSSAATSRFRIDPWDPFWVPDAS